MRAPEGAPYIEEQRLLLGPQDRSSELLRVLRIAWEPSDVLPDSGRGGGGFGSTGAH